MNKIYKYQLYNINDINTCILETDKKIFIDIIIKHMNEKITNRIKDEFLDIIYYENYFLQINYCI